VGTVAPDTEPLSAGIWRILWSQRLEREARRRRLGRDATWSSTCPPTASSSRPAPLSVAVPGHRYDEQTFDAMIDAGTALTARW